MRNLNILSALLLIFLVLSTSCNEQKVEETEATTQGGTDSLIELNQAELENTTIEIGTLVKRPLSKTLNVFGELAVAPKDIAEIHLAHQAFIEYSQILPGESVVKGQVLAYFSHPEISALQSEFLAAINTEKQLQEDYERKKELGKNQSISKRSIQESEANYFSQKVKRESTQQMLQQLGVNISALQKGDLQERLAVRAPFDGVVTEVNINRGMLVTPDKSLFELINLDEMHLEFEVFPKDAALLKEGQLVTFKLPEGQHIYQSELHFINKKVQGNSIIAHADLAEPVDIPLGANLNVSIQLTSDSLLLIPKTATVQSGKRYFAFEKLSKGKFQKIEIKKLDEDETHLAIEELKDWESRKFVVDGAYYLR
ncbi:efflux RND transporter periplasmic adaptor subunit [Marivirga sp. S37H4]|uniref:Efflux RND transporter periplasmic adaptor subunit n=1 Tax=Marivirga aurantiaca TaxID=2802615 RepID=A0A935CBW8_9BACT|nr:efflux RND transporter periplasmic adaptor subunit [Marivirga aurantiaca]MBK6267385.1 efflux RND transporter periplasmic adaptor subunit [Marivirga aurantiaca]